MDLFPTTKEKNSPEQEQLEGPVAKVAIVGVPTFLDYYIPASLSDSAGVGSQVSISLRSRTATGWIVAVTAEQRLSNLKPIISAVPIFPPEQMKLFEWMADYYGVTIAEVLDTAVPPQKTTKKSTKVSKSLERFFGNASIDIVDSQQLTPTQVSALSPIAESIEQGKFSSFLLHGVTGSGKTEVYVHAIRKTLALGRSALLIVPEISLTPQLLDYLRQRLHEPLALLHSQISPADRWMMWQKLYSGELRVAVGARSAVFAPTRQLGLIIVDEEHESSYKQGDHLRYNARDLSVMRAKYANCPVVLGSATPSFESLYNAATKRYSLLEMPDRVTSRPLPTIEVVDLTKIKRRDYPSPNISPQLFEAISSTLANSGQVVILYNRRGFASYLQCSSCGESINCPNCSVTLTFHKRNNSLLCHHCGFGKPAPDLCERCRDPRLTRAEEDLDEEMGTLLHQGSGTERVVDELATLFPSARIIRMDRDTIGAKGNYREVLDQMRAGTADILVGTQMIAKGHDLPGVTLVGIIDADVGLHLPDFRASERSYQLITQAAGRAGRGTQPGRVVVQTREPNHPTILASSTNRFRAFAKFELAQRKKLSYPPYGRLVRLIISSTDRAVAEHGSTAVLRELRNLVASMQAEVSILGPCPAPLEKLKGRFRYHLLIKASSAKVLSTISGTMNRWKKELKGSKDLRLVVDLDPIDML